MGMIGFADNGSRKFAMAQGVGQVPRDCFPLPVGVRGQVHGLGILNSLGQLGDDAFPPFGGQVARAVGRLVDADVIPGQIAHVADAGHDLPSLTQETLYFFDLARGFNNQKVHVLPHFSLLATSRRLTTIGEAAGDTVCRGLEEEDDIIAGALLPSLARTAAA